MRRLVLIPLSLCLMMMAGCKEKFPNSNRDLSIEYYKNISNDDYAINSKVIREWMDSLMRGDKDRHVADLHTRNYYQNHGGFLWIDRHGIDHRADTLVSYLRTVTQMGFNKKRFMVDEIEEDIKKLRKLDLSGAIIGKAIYTGGINLKEALKCAKEGEL